jgi:hypothetical protein
MKKTLYLENPSRQELYDALKSARGMGYKRVVAHGSKFHREFGVKKKVYKLSSDNTSPVIASSLGRGRSL